MSDTELCYLSATEAVARFRRRELSPVELMRALIARAEAVEPRVNAFANTYFDEALDRARRAETKAHDAIIARKMKELRTRGAGRRAVALGRGAALLHQQRRNLVREMKRPEIVRPGKKRGGNGGGAGCHTFCVADGRSARQESNR